MTPAPLSRGRAWLVAVFATLAMSVSYVDRQVMSAIGASVRKALELDAAQFGLLAAAFSMAYLVGAPLAGILVDRVGARRGLTAAIVTWSMVSALHAVVPTFAALFALRVMLGAAESPSFPAAAQTVRRVLPEGDRSAAFGLLFTGSSLGAAIAAPLAISLDVAFGWRAAFFIASAVGMVWLPIWLLVTSPKPVRDALGTAGVASVARPRGLLRDPAVHRAVVLVLASAPTTMFMYIWLPQYLELGRGLPKPSLPQYLWLPPLMADMGMVGFGALASRLDRRVGLGVQRSHVELVLAAATMAATLVLVPHVQATWPAVLVVGLAAAGAGGLYTLLTADMMSRIDPARVSAAGGLTAAAQSLVYVVLNPIVGRWIDVSHSYDGPLALLGGVAIPGAVAWSLWSPAQARHEPQRG
ncbi:MAG TPA: MFS transporter [Polyangiaceae bacterium]|nr:MFS transporter [Polyangiaceae bacterium]